MPEQPQTTEFNVVNAMGRIYRRSAKGEFGVQPAAAQAFMNNYVVADASASAQYSQGSARHSPFVSSGKLPLLIPRMCGTDARDCQLILTSVRLA